MNLDFCFMDDARIVAITGWSTEPRPDLQLYVDDHVLRPLLVSRHLRRDLRSAEPMGLVALFDLSGLDLDPTQATIHLSSDQDFKEIDGYRLDEDLCRLVEIGVDEVFFAVLRLFAAKKVRFAEGAILRAISGRTRALPSAPRETENFVLAVDRCQGTDSGQGLVIGWFIAASGHRDPLCALAIEDQMIVPVDLQLGSMARPDLAGYAGRYDFTGRDGYGGGWHFPRPPSGPVRLLLMIPGEPFLPGVLVQVEQARPAELAHHVTAALLEIEDVNARLGLRRAILPSALRIPVLPEIETETSGDVLLLLDHDLTDSDLRDVLRCLAPHLHAPLRLHLLRPDLSAALQNAIEAASRDMGTRVVLEAADLSIVRPKTLPGRVIFARSAALFQLDPAVLLAPQTCAQVLLIDPIGTVMAEAVASVERFSRDQLPFALAVEGAMFFDMLDQIPDYFLTQEARLRLLVGALMAQNSVELTRADVYRYFEGKSGPHCQSFADGGDWHAYDAESCRLIERHAP